MAENSSNNLQDVVRCKLCEKPNPELYCCLCHINLCKICAGEHLLDESKIHTVIPIKQRRSSSHYPTCPKHSTKRCELHCGKCDTPVCTRCVASEEHAGHRAKDLMTIFQSKKETLQRDFQELEKFLIDEYQERAKNIEVQKASIVENSQKLLEVISKRREDWRREIDTITQREKTKVNDMRTKCMYVLDKQKGEITKQISQIKQNMSDLKKLLDYNDVYMISSYKSLNAEFRKLPPTVITTASTFSSQKIDTKQLQKQFGVLSEFSISQENKTES